MANPHRISLISNQIAQNSPMTDLAINLSNANINYSARRKLSLSSIADSPNVPGSPMAVSPINSPDRLLKTNLRFSGAGTPVGSGAARKGGFVRRLSHLGDENYNPMQSSPVVSPSKFLAVRQVSGNSSTRARQPLEDHDPNSLDSGYSYSDDSKSTSLSSDFAFAQPSGLAPRRSATDSPRRGPHSSSSSGSDSFDDGFCDFILPLQDEEAQLPAGLGGLIKDPIINHGVSADSHHFFSFRDVISENMSPMSPVVEEQPQQKSKKRMSTTPLGEVTPVSKRHKPLVEANTPTLCLAAETATVTPRRSQHTLFAYGFKRLAEPRPALNHSLSLEDPTTPPPRPKFRHCLSESEAVIKRALHRSSQEELIGDFSRAFALPLTVGSHQDLKSISPNTMAALINGEFSESVASFQIIDCRYPYEYEGGHIRGAVNIYTKDQLMKEFLENRPPPTTSPITADSKRDIVVFHCEFSSERGPGLSRFLRSKDRENNAYPALHYPELYLLEGGYKAFFMSRPELCEPQAYRKMVDTDKDQLQHFRAKSKTWSGDKSNRVLKRSTSFKRLGL